MKTIKICLKDIKNPLCEGSFFSVRYGDKIRFGKDLKEKVQKRVDREKIGEWAYIVYVDWENRRDSIFLDLLITLGTMELGPEFYYSYEELEKIADDLIAGKEVVL